MRTIDIGKVGSELSALINEIDPIEEDIGIVGKEGRVLAVVIKNDAYKFFLQKVEEEEDRQDIQTVKEFHESREKDQ